MHSTRSVFGDVDRAFEELTRGLSGGSAAGFGAVDAALDPESGTLTASIDLPGVDRDSLNVQVIGDAIVVEATRSRPGATGRVLAAERPAGRVRRVLRTRRALESDAVSASYDDGVLTLRAGTRSPGHRVAVSFSPTVTDGEALTADGATADGATESGESVVARPTTEAN